MDKPKDEQHFQPLDIINITITGMVFVTGIAFRILIKKKYKRKVEPLPSKQIISNDVGFAVSSCALIITSVKIALPEIGLHMDTIASLSLCYVLTVIICLHEDLRNYSRRKISPYLEPVVKTYLEAVKSSSQFIMFPFMTRFVLNHETPLSSECQTTEDNVKLFMDGFDIKSHKFVPNSIEMSKVPNVSIVSYSPL